ncbi:MAG: hypothetical protein WC934_06155 [Acidithiobacillus sp.]|jgi:hypothetical protein|uniref:hypothetical protein n=1 Tax=Acidithiobacillus sp. TaxID=1872118 RepID=UPI00355F37FE
MKKNKKEVENMNKKEESDNNDFDFDIDDIMGYNSTCIQNRKNSHDWLEIIIQMALINFNNNKNKGISEYSSDWTKLLLKTILDNSSDRIITSHDVIDLVQYLSNIHINQINSSIETFDLIVKNKIDLTSDERKKFLSLNRKCEWEKRHIFYHLISNMFQIAIDNNIPLGQKEIEYINNTLKEEVKEDNENNNIKEMKL